MDNYLKEIFIFMLAAFGIIAVLYLAISWEVYKYNDCKQVGHSTVYCIFTKR